jgi:hypothetical protein
MEPSKPPAWELGPKANIEANRLVRDDSDSLGRVMLALALAFNDLKGMVMFEAISACDGAPWS